uniref:Uncharacterized protein n=1 Tax=Prolemur simus TaxID=1328070 RepID=A0A8C8YJU0_PROSS
MVGMPYPNVTSPELQEKMAYLDQTLVILPLPSPESLPRPEVGFLTALSCPHSFIGRSLPLPNAQGHHCPYAVWLGPGRQGACPGRGYPGEDAACSVLPGSRHRQPSPWETTWPILEKRGVAAILGPIPGQPPP